MKWYQLDKKETANYLLLLALNFLFVFPIILMLNNLYLNDDLGWSLGRSLGFKGDGRPLLEYLSLFLCGGEPVTDTAPLPLILGILFLSYVLILYAKTNLDFISDRSALLAVLLFIRTNPLLVDCGSYRYGSLGGLLSISLPFIIFSLPDTVSNIRTFLYAMLLTMSLMSLQQAAIGMCLILFIAQVFFLLFQDRKINYTHEGLRLAGIVTGAILYKTIIATHYISHSDWRYNASQTLEIKLESLFIVFQNIIDICKFLLAVFSETAWWYQIALPLFVISAVLLSILLYCRESEKKGWRRILDISFLLFSPFCVFIASFLALTLLKTLTLKFAIFTTFGGVLLYLGILPLYFARKHPALIRSFLVLLIVCNLYHYTRVYSYTNAVNNQHEYFKYIVYHIAHDLETINADGEFTRFSFTGQVPQPKRTQIFSEKYPITAKLLIPASYFSNDGWIGGSFVLHYLQDDLTLEDITDADIQIVGSEEPAMKNSIYACYLNGDKIIVSFD